MSLYIGKIGNQFVHTYSKELRDEYIKDNYVIVFTLGTGRNGGLKIRNSISIRDWIKKYEKGEFLEYEIATLESGRTL